MFSCTIRSWAKIGGQIAFASGLVPPLSRRNSYHASGCYLGLITHLARASTVRGLFNRRQLTDQLNSALLACTLALRFNLSASLAISTLDSEVSTILVHLPNLLLHSYPRRRGSARSNRHVNRTNLRSRTFLSGCRSLLSARLVLQCHSSSQSFAISLIQIITR